MSPSWKDNRLIIVKVILCNYKKKRLNSRIDMRWRYSFCLVVLAILSIAGLSAQGVTYPEPVHKLFEKADAEITEYYHSGKILRYALRRAQDTAQNDTLAFQQSLGRPTIAIPDCEEAEYLRNLVSNSGGIPVDMPRKDCSTIDLRAVSAIWDGVAMPDGWVAASNQYSILVYKTITDWNIPYIGTSDLTRTIDKGLRRLPCDISSFNALIKKARTFRKAVRLMDDIFSIDTHCDLPDMYQQGWSVGKRSISQAGIPKMDEGHLDAQVLISFLWQGSTDDVSSKRAAERNLVKIGQIKKDVERYPDLCGIAKTPAEAESLRAAGKKAFMIALENGYGIGKDLGNIKKMKDLGVVYITLCHFRDNSICHTSSRHGSDPSKGLTEFGIKVVEEMNRQGILVDLSHPSAGTFWDCVKYSKAPVICSHSGAKVIYGHDRGLDDKQLKALAENGGVIQVYTVPEYLGRPKDSITIDDVMRHFDHCVNVAGAEHVGIGSDFDGGGGVWGCNGDNDLINLTVKMLERGYTSSQIKGFWGGNFMRVLREAQAIANQD